MADNTRLIANQLLEDRMETATTAFTSVRHYIRSVSRTSSVKVKDHLAEMAATEISRLAVRLNEALEMALNI